MADREHTKQPVEETRPTPAEVEADPPVEVSLADADEPEDR